VQNSRKPSAAVYPAFTDFFAGKKCIGKVILIPPAAANFCATALKFLSQIPNKD